MKTVDWDVSIRLFSLKLGTCDSLAMNAGSLPPAEELDLLTILLELADKTWSPTLRNHKDQLQRRAKELHCLLTDIPPTSAQLYQAASELANEGKEISPESLSARVDDIRKREQFDHKMKQKAAALDHLVRQKSPFPTHSHETSGE